MFSKDTLLSTFLERLFGSRTPLQPILFDILLRNRLKMLCITGDIQKAFLQIKVGLRDRDALRLLGYENLDSRTVRQYRFTRVIFGSRPSPYILGATLQKHVSQYADKYPSTADELLKNTYVDDVQSGGDCVEELISFKKEATRIMEERGFHLHKWQSQWLEPIPKKHRYLEYPGTRQRTQFQLVS